MEDNILELYSPIQVDVIDRDAPGRPIPLQAVGSEHRQEYLSRVMWAFFELHAQEEARSAFTAHDQDWSEICEKIISVTRTVRLVNDRPYGVYVCRSTETLDPDDVDSLKRYCRDQWENGWGEGYAHCPREGPNLGLYIHFWQDPIAPLLAREQLPAVQDVEHSTVPVTEITPDTFWTLLEQAKNVCGQDQRACAYWLTERLVAMGPEQAKAFDTMARVYMDLAYQYGLWTAASVIERGGCTDDGFMDFRQWLVAQGKGVYMAALKDPDSLADAPDYRNSQFDSLPLMGDYAYEELTGRNAFEDFDPDQYHALVTELKKDVVYGDGIGYPYDAADVPAYLPRLCQKYGVLNADHSHTVNVGIWNLTNPEIQAAKKTAQKSKKVQDRGNSR